METAINRSYDANLPIFLQKAEIKLHVVSLATLLPNHHGFFKVLDGISVISLLLCYEYSTTLF
jgi:hypothetical protein